ncbi:MAG: hypothetical protein K0R75_3813 [Paenibacillaceae bacterium]|jgi:hypothetical protein|nr:hypothetical protein [Paenibacillaceae bacterium]
MIPVLYGAGIFLFSLEGEALDEYVGLFYVNILRRNSLGEQRLGMPANSAVSPIDKEVVSSSCSAFLMRLCKI